jgi:hypothetical protein
LGHYFISHTKNQFYEVEGLNVKGSTLKLLEENTEHIYEIETENDF